MFVHWFFCSNSILKPIELCLSLLKRYVQLLSWADSINHGSWVTLRVMYFLLSCEASHGMFSKIWQVCHMFLLFDWSYLSRIFFLWKTIRGDVLLEYFWSMFSIFTASRRIEILIILNNNRCIGLIWLLNTAIFF